MVAQTAWGWASVFVEGNDFSDLSSLGILDGNGVTGEQADRNSTPTFDLVTLQCGVTAPQSRFEQSGGGVYGSHNLRVATLRAFCKAIVTDKMPL
jgi:hypothetical protein